MIGCGCMEFRHMQSSDEQRFWKIPSAFWPGPGYPTGNRRETSPVTMPDPISKFNGHARRIRICGACARRKPGKSPCLKI